jgi:N-succinyldiaminopimelate aminotransferase
MDPHLALLRPYPFERLRELLRGHEPPPSLRGIPLSIGEPRHAPPAFVTAALIEALDTLGSYPLVAGLPQLRETIARWLERRYALPNAAVDPESMVLPVNGTREALFAFVQAVVDRAAHPAPLVLMPNPFYQIYEGAALLAGAQCRYLPCDAGNGFLPDLDAVPDHEWAACQLLFLCSPANPTGAVMSETYLRRALELAERHDFVVAADECYAEIYLCDAAPPGLLQAAWNAGRRRFERCVVFHSLSKRSCVPGLRSGFVAGDPALLAPFRLYRTYHGCAMPLHTQQASIAAWSDENHVIENRRLYRAKFAAVMPLLEDVLDVTTPAGAFYLWPRVGDDERFTRDLHAQQNVTVLPGSYLGREVNGTNPGRGRVRISLVASVGDCVEAAQRIRRFVTGTQR